jgi:hypothetical protein
MKASTLLKKKGIDPDEAILLISAKEAMENILETIEEYCPKLKINKMTKEDIESLLDSYSSCVINYHPESCHQERAALLAEFETLQHYGLTKDDYHYLDFY